MPFPLAAAVMGGASLLGGLFGNSSNAKMQAAANESNERIARQNREWQENMSNSAYQRQKEDMMKAGLNPIMAADGGGSSTPSGSTATAGAAQMEDVLGKGIASAMAARSLIAEVEGKESQVALNQAAQDTELTKQSLNASSAVAQRELALKTMVDYDRVELENKALKSQLPAIQSRAEADKQTADFDKASAKYDAIMKRVGQGVGIASDAASVVKPKIQIGPSGETKYDRYDPKTWRYKNRNE